MGRLPEPDRARVTGEHNRVVPAPHHDGGSRCLGDGYQVALAAPAPAAVRETAVRTDGGNSAVGYDGARVLFGPQHDAVAEPWANHPNWPARGEAGQNRCLLMSERESARSSGSLALR